MGPDVREEDKDAGDRRHLVSGPVFTISFLRGHAHAVKPFPVLPMKALSSLGELGLEFGEGLGNI